jgi:hypothetical protein
MFLAPAMVPVQLGGFQEYREAFLAEIPDSERNAIGGSCARRN